MDQWTNGRTNEWTDGPNGRTSEGGFYMMWGGGLSELSEVSEVSELVCVCKWATLRCGAYRGRQRVERRNTGYKVGVVSRLNSIDPRL